MPKVTYVGPLPRGRVHLATRVADFVRGVALEVDADEAKALPSDEWTTKATSKPSKSTPVATGDDTEGDPQ